MVGIGFILGGVVSLVIAVINLLFSGTGGAQHAATAERTILKYGVIGVVLLIVGIWAL